MLDEEFETFVEDDVLNAPPIEEKKDSLDILMSQQEIDEVQSSIDKMPADGKMVEWGSGGSTVAWLTMLTSEQTLISIEHSKFWYEKVTNFIDANYVPQPTFLYCLAEAAWPEVYAHTYSTVYEEHPFGLRDYIIPAAREENPKADVLDADVYFIDGVARAAVAATIMLFSRNENAVYYIHDYVGREGWYNWLCDRLPYRKTVGTLLKFSKKEHLV